MHPWLLADCTQFLLLKEGKIKGFNNDVVVENLFIRVWIHIYQTKRGQKGSVLLTIPPLPSNFTAKIIGWTSLGLGKRGVLSDGISFRFVIRLCAEDRSPELARVHPNPLRRILVPKLPVMIFKIGGSSASATFRRVPFSIFRWCLIPVTNI